jgi:ribosomal protein S18 acetylase RimI-like enzyme
MSDIDIRIAAIADAPELARLNAQFNGSSDPPEALAARLTDPRRVETALVAERDGRLVAFAGLRVVPGLFYAEPQAELTELYVDEDVRRMGIGRALVDEAVRLARQAGATGIVVRTGGDNEPALRLYRASGFEPDDVSLWKTLGTA